MPYDQQSMNPMQMMQLANSMLQPRTIFQPSGQGGGMQAGPYYGGAGGSQGGTNIPEAPDPLDGYSDDQIARAYYKRQSRGTRIGNKSYAG